MPATTMPEPLTPERRRLYAVINTCSAPLWLAMIIAPEAAVTRWLMRLATPLFLTLGVTYTGLLGAGVARAGGPVNYVDPEAVRRSLTQPETFLAAWTHYISFDLFVGRWIWQDALDRGARPPRLALLLT